MSAAWEQARHHGDGHMEEGNASCSIMAGAGWRTEERKVEDAAFDHDRGFGLDDNRPERPRATGVKATVGDGVGNLVVVGDFGGRLTGTTVVDPYLCGWLATRFRGGTRF